MTKVVSVYVAVFFSMLAMASPSLAQNNTGAPVFECRNTTGIESEEYLFELLGRATPTGGCSFSFARTISGGIAYYQVFQHANMHSQGPATALCTVTADWTIPMPNYARVSSAASSMFGSIGARSAALVAARLNADDGIAYVVLQVQSTIPNGVGGSYLQLDSACVMATSKTQEQAITQARSLAVQLEADAAAEWVANGFPVEMLDPQPPALGSPPAPNQPNPAPLPRPASPYRILWVYPAPVGEDQQRTAKCGSGANFSNSLWGNPSRILEDAAGGSFRVDLTIRCLACEPPRPNLCLTGDPRWFVRLIKKGTSRVGNYFFDAKIDLQSEYHEVNEPEGPPGDVWGIDVLWSIEYKEAFPLRLEFWDPGQLPPNYWWTRVYKCSASVCCCLP